MKREGAYAIKVKTGDKWRWYRLGPYSDEDLVDHWFKRSLMTRSEAEGIKAQLDTFNPSMRASIVTVWRKS